MSDMTQEQLQVTLHNSANLHHNSSIVCMHNCCALLSSLASAAMSVPLTEATPRTDCGVLCAFKVKKYVGNFTGMSVHL
jgi:hypothetical protein